MTIDLIVVYQSIDHVGYEDAIRVALEHLEKANRDETGNCRYLLQISKINFALDRDDFDAAIDLTMTGLAWLDSDTDRHTADHFRVEFTTYPAYIAFKQRDWAKLAMTAVVAEEAARQRKSLNELARALLWQAIAARTAGDGLQANRLFRAAQTQRRKLGRSPGPWFYEAWAFYLELGGSLSEIVSLRNQEYNEIRDRGMLAYECWILTELCRLKVAMGTFQPEDREAAYQAALRLRKPERYLAALESAVTGKSTSA